MLIYEIHTQNTWIALIIFNMNYKQKFYWTLTSKDRKKLHYLLFIWIRKYHFRWCLPVLCCYDSARCTLRACPHPFHRSSCMTCCILFFSFFLKSYQYSDHVRDYPVRTPAQINRLILGQCNEPIEYIFEDLSSLLVAFDMWCKLVWELCHFWLFSRLKFEGFFFSINHTYVHHYSPIISLANFVISQFCH